MSLAKNGSIVTVTIDGRPVTVPKGTTVWHAARDLGIDIPIFCYQDRMPPLGACRQCLVRVEKVPRWQTSCTLEATEGMVVHASDPDVREAQEYILEYLLINHPLDCPICDKGGECPLQDQTYLYGPGRSRFIETKRDFAKPVSLGSVLVLDRERCVLCWRCVRFGEIVAGDHALKGFDRGFATEIDTPYTQPIDSKFIGNTIAICPVGALTSKGYRFLARPWDNQPVPSVCNHCGLGCEVWLDVRGDQVTRVRAREAPDLNDIWLCDLGQFGYEFINSPQRLTRPLIRRGSGLVEASWREALDRIATQLEGARSVDPRRIAVVGGQRLTNEDNYLVRRFFREVIGTPHLDHRVDARPGSASLDVAWGLRTPLTAIESADVLLLVGCDITEEYPIAWLRMKAALNRGARLYAIHPKGLEIARHMAGGLLSRPGAEGTLLGHLVDVLAGRGFDVSLVTAGAPGTMAAGADAADAADVFQQLVDDLKHAARPMVFLGKTALEGPAGHEVLEAATKLQERGAAVHIMRGKGNAVGAAMMGLLPGARGWTAPEIIQHAAGGQVDVLYVLGADPATDVADADAWRLAREHTPFIVVQDLFLTETARGADVVLPVLTWAEKDGTVTNLEGRIQSIKAARRGPGETRSDTEILTALARRLGTTLGYAGWEEIFDEVRGQIAGLAINAVLTPPPLPKRAADARAKSRGEAAGVDTSMTQRSEDGFVLVTADVLFDRASMTSRSPRITDLAGVPEVWVHPEDAGRVNLAPGDLAVLRAAGREGLVLRAKLTRDTAPGRLFVPRRFDTLPLRSLLTWAAPFPRVTLAPLASSP